MNENYFDEEDFLLNEPRKKRSWYMHIIMTLMVISIIVLYFAEFVFIQIPAGHKGVLYDPLGNGTNTEDFYDEGLHIIFPWNELIIYNTRIQEGEMTTNTLTEDGLEVEVTVSYRFRPEADSLGVLHKDIGPTYVETIILPLVATVVRDVVSHHHVDRLYSISRNSLQVDMSNQVQRHIHGHYPIQIIDLLIKGVVLHEEVEKAIAEKLVEEQKMLAYDFILRREEQEAERKRIEGQGIRDFADTTSIDYLKLRGLEATEHLATSPNAKVVVIGTDSKELPIILGNN